MMRVLGTWRPARIDKCVVQPLLNVFDNSQLEVNRIIAELPNPGGRLFQLRFVTRPDRLDEISSKESKHPVHLALGDLLFPTAPNDIAGRTVGHAVANRDVAGAKELTAHDAEVAPVGKRQLLLALSTRGGPVNLPHNLILNPSFEHDVPMLAELDPTMRLRSPARALHSARPS